MLVPELSSCSAGALPAPEAAPAEAPAPDFLAELGMTVDSSTGWVLQVGQYLIGETHDPQLSGHPQIRY